MTTEDSEMSEDSELSPLQTWNISRSVISDIRDIENPSKQKADEIVAECELACDTFPSQAYETLQSNEESPLDEVARSLVAHHDEAEQTDNKTRKKITDVDTRGILSDTDAGWNSSQSTAAEIKQSTSESEVRSALASSDVEIGEEFSTELYSIREAITDSGCPSEEVTKEIARHLLGSEYKLDSTSSLTVEMETHDTEKKLGEENEHSDTSSKTTTETDSQSVEQMNGSTLPRQRKKDTQTRVQGETIKIEKVTQPLSQEEFNSGKILPDYTATDKYEKVAATLIRAFNRYDNSLDYTTIQKMADINIDWPPRHIVLMKTKSQQGADSRTAVNTLKKWIMGIEEEEDEIPWEPAPYRGGSTVRR